MNDVVRCPWAGTDPIYCAYHDDEWGVPVHDDRKLFEMLILEGFQAGLSWITILKRREGFRKAFANWDWNKVAKFDSVKIEELMNDTSIIRNRLKINSTINNAVQFIAIRKEFGSFDKYIWKFTDNQTIRPSKRPKTLGDFPTHTTLSDSMSKELQKRGLKFVGTVVCYSFMQAVGMVDDHMESCFRAQ